MGPYGNGIKSRTHIVGKSGIFKDERDTLEEEIMKWGRGI